MLKQNDVKSRGVTASMCFVLMVFNLSAATAHLLMLICRCVSGQSFTHLGMLFHKDRKTKHAIEAHFSQACASVVSIFI